MTGAELMIHCLPGATCGLNPPGGETDGSEGVKRVSFITDATMKERVLHVFSALPEDMQEEFMRDPGFVIGIYDTGRWGSSAGPRRSRLF